MGQAIYTEGVFVYLLLINKLGIEYGEIFGILSFLAKSIGFKH